MGGDGTFIETLSGPQRGEEVNRHLLPLYDCEQSLILAKLSSPRRLVEPFHRFSLLLFCFQRHKAKFFQNSSRNFITSNNVSILFIVITIHLFNDKANFYRLYFYVFQDFSITNCSYKTCRGRSPKENRNNVRIPFVPQTYRGRCYYHLSPYVFLATFSIFLCSRNIVIARYTL